LLAKIANDNACILDKRGGLGFFASKLAPTGILLSFFEGTLSRGQ